MINFPKCKINLGLYVTERRKDGYHNLETIFYPVSLEDALEIVLASDNITSLHLSGIPIDGNPEDNLIMKGVLLLKKKYSIPPIHIFLHKNIPFGSGLGGGSSDAAHTLQMLNKLFQLNLTKTQLFDFAVQLGSDCPFFLESKPMFATGAGHIFEEIGVNLNEYFLLLIKPPCAVNTKEAYENIVPKKPKFSLKDSVKRPVSEWKEFIFNDFEEIIFKKHPVVQQTKALLYDKGALFASMSGSGSAVYGIFEHFPEMNVPKDFLLYKIKL